MSFKIIVIFLILLTSCVNNTEKQRSEILSISNKFYNSGMEKVEKASEAYDLFYNTEGFDPHQYFINQTL